MQKIMGCRTIASRARLMYLVLSLFWIAPGYSKIYDWVRIDHDDIKILKDPVVASDFRLNAIRTAEKTIDLCTFDQRPDSLVGMPILDALEEAVLKRGVKVRFSSASTLLPFKDPGRKIKRKLAALAKKSKNFQYILIGNSNMVMKKGWKWTDQIHEKLLIVDGRTDFPRAFTTGSGQGSQYLEWIDTSFLIKGSFVSQMQAAFDHLWITLQREGSKKPIEHEITWKGKLPPGGFEIQGTVDLQPDENGYLSRGNQAIEVERLIQWSHMPSRAGGDLKIRTLHHEFFEQMRWYAQKSRLKPKRFTLDQRLSLIYDPILDEVVDQVRTATDVRLTMFSLALHPKLKSALISRLNHDSGFKLSLLTNSKKAHENILFLKPSPGWFGGLEDLDDLLHYDQTHVYLLQPTAKEDPRYLHRKLVVLNQDPGRSGKQGSVLFGSHNMTCASSVSLDEMSFQVEGDSFVERVNRFFEDSIDQPYISEVDRDEIARSRKRNVFAIWLGKKLKWLY